MSKCSNLIACDSPLQRWSPLLQLRHSRKLYSHDRHVWQAFSGSRQTLAGGQGAGREGLAALAISARRPLRDWRLQSKERPFLEGRAALNRQVLQKVPGIEPQRFVQLPGSACGLERVRIDAGPSERVVADAASLLGCLEQAADL